MSLYLPFFLALFFLLASSVFWWALPLCSLTWTSTRGPAHLDQHTWLQSAHPATLHQPRLIVVLVSVAAQLRSIISVFGFLANACCLSLIREHLQRETKLMNAVKEKLNEYVGQKSSNNYLWVRHITHTN